jgi:tetratricopeptide (TPR) repeat protein
LTAELVAVADELEDPAITSRALSVRVRAAMEAGDVAEVDRCLRLNQSIVQEAGQPALAWWIGLHQTGQALLAGHLDEADRLATATLELGERLGHPDARTYFLGAQFQLRFEQDRLGELETEVPAIAAASGVAAIEAMVSQLYYEVGRHTEARTIFEDLAGRDFPFPADILWLLGMCSSAAVCAAFKDPDRASVLYPGLLPYPRHLVTYGGGTIVNGSGAHYLGVLATILARFDDAEEHFAAAQAIHDALGAPTWLARTRLEWARMLLIRRGPGDAERARELLGQVLDKARELGLVGVERHAVALMGDLP